MANPWFSRWSLALVLILLIVVLVAAATVVMAHTVLQPKVVPTIKVQPAVVKPGDVVVVTGEGWPVLPNLVLVVALSPTKDLVSEGLLPVSATKVGPDGTLAATFAFPAEVPWATLREAWVVVRPGTGNLQASARLTVQRLRPTPTPTVAVAATPIPGRPQIQGTIVQLALQQGLLTLRPLDGSPDRGVRVSGARVRFVDGRSAALSDLQVGRMIAAEGWFDSAGTLLAEELTILESTGTPVSVPATVCLPTVVLKVPTPCVAVLPTACPPQPKPTPVPIVHAPARPTPPPVTVLLNRWTGEFYDNASLAGVPAYIREAEVIDFHWRFGPPISDLPRQGYSIRWTGVWDFARTCRYRFLLLLKGGARLYVDGRLLLDLWGCPPAAEYPAHIDLAAGPHQICLEFLSTGPDARVQLRWEYGAAVP